MTVYRIGLAMLLSAPLLTADDAKGARLFADARAAIGGEARLSKVQAFTVIGGSAIEMPDGTQVRELRIDVQLPDKLLRTDTQSRGDAQFVMLRGVNGDALLRNSKIVNGSPGMRFSKPPSVGGSEGAAIKFGHDEVARHALAFLLSPPPGVPLHFAYAGEAQSPDGTADVLDITGAGGFAAKLFLDKTSHRPLMLTYRDFDSRFMVRPRPGSAPGVAISTERTVREMTWYFEEYRAESGIQMPHRIGISVDGEIDEEWTVKRVVLNPIFKAGAFSDQ